VQGAAGRIAFAFHDRVDIQPIHYVFSEGLLFGRTAEGAKLVTLEHNRWLAFEVDEIRSMFDWESVVVHGRFERLEPEGTKAERAAAQEAIEALRALVPATFTTEDPVAFRTVLFQIHILEMSGRAASSSATPR
jgi:nitroimidazol reductase NimA-like FMN-containing flavoprotein (pyridoxamine 5'-phosphate oxidase superfamily)